MKYRVGIITGRYEMVHPGHIKTILRCAAECERLLVYVVANPESAYPSEWSRELLELATPSNVTVCLNPCHFGYARQSDVDQLEEHDVFYVANPAVYQHLQQFGLPLQMIYGTPGYSSTQIRDRTIAAAIRGERRGRRPLESNDDGNGRSDERENKNKT